MPDKSPREQQSENRRHDRGDGAPFVRWRPPDRRQGPKPDWQGFMTHHRGPWGRARRIHHGLPPHMVAWRGKRGSLFFRFALAFGFLLFLIAGGLGALISLLRRVLGGEAGSTSVALLGAALMVLGFLTLGFYVARRIFRGMATPLADVMSAAEEVAKGDLTVRVTEQGPAEFGRLVSSFNRMVEQLERADQRRRDLTADVAHDLRTPLHIIQGNLEGILDGVYEPTPEHIEDVLEETRRLSRLVEDLRILSLAEAGQLSLVWEDVEVAELLEDLTTSFGGQAEAAGIALQVDASELEHASVRGDYGRLAQVLGNLLANALQSTASGGTILLRGEASDDTVRLQVQDTGAGIPEEDLPYVFDRFWRGDRARSQADGTGSGLGLPIARQLVRAHGGEIAIESTVGRGTTVTVELPRS